MRSHLKRVEALTGVPMALVSTGFERDDTILMQHPLNQTAAREHIKKGSFEFMTDTGHLYVTWERYHRLIELLALQIHDSKWEFDHIIAIARGGLRVGDQLSRIFDKPLAIMSTSSYVEEGGTVRGKLLVSEHLTMTSAASEIGFWW